MLSSISIRGSYLNVGPSIYLSVSLSVGQSLSLKILGVPENVPHFHKMFHLSKKEPHIWITRQTTLEEFYGTLDYLFLGHLILEMILNNKESNND